MPGTCSGTSVRRRWSRRRWKKPSAAFPFSAFGGIDGHDVIAVIFAGGLVPGPFSFQIDEVGFR